MLKVMTHNVNLPRLSGFRFNSVCATKAAKESKPKPSRQTVEPPSGTLGPGTGPIWSVKFWFGNPVPHVHVYVPGVTPRLAKVALL